VPPSPFRRLRSLLPLLLLGGSLTAAIGAAAPIVPSTALRQHVARFNAMEDEPIVNLVPNAAAADWLEANIPRFSCPDAELEEIYFFRWWAVRKHLRRPPGPDGRPAATGHVFTEFINRPQPVSSALGHQLMEGRWLRDPTYHDDSVRWWLRGDQGRPQPKLHFYSQWLTDALWQRTLATGDQRLVVGLLDDLVADYRAWEQERQREDGLFWQRDVRDAMEESISGSRTCRHVRPTINSYMFGNARAVAAIARLAGRTELAREFDAKAARLRQLTQDYLWNAADTFFEVRQEDGPFAAVREQLGFIPWYFHLPEPGRGYEAAWRQLTDEAGFNAPCGLTTAERRHPAFRSHGVGSCEWDGAVWPFATAQTLTALAHVLHDYPGAPVTNEDYFAALRTYAHSHRMNGQPYLGEYLDERTGAWLKGDHPRSRWYNHSTFADLIITGLAGLRPRLDDTLEVSPLLPLGKWDWFALDDIPYHGRSVAILWDREGTHFQRGRGLSVWVDGQPVARSDQLGPVTAQLPARPAVPPARP
jgi:hypothetical protein